MKQLDPSELIDGAAQQLLSNPTYARMISELSGSQRESVERAVRDFFVSVMKPIGNVFSSTSDRAKLRDELTHKLKNK